jgi:hypothetical protein
MIAPRGWFGDPVEPAPALSDAREPRRLDGFANVAFKTTVPKLPTFPAPDRRPPASQAAQPIKPPVLVGAPTREIAERMKRVRAAMLIDASGSEYQPEPYGDPTGKRCAAGKTIARGMAKAGGGKLAIVPWGTSAPASLATKLLDAKNDRKALDDALANPPCLGGNNLPAALDRARQILGPLGDDEIAFIPVLTDGWEYVTPAMHAAVASLPTGSVHMLLVTPGLNTELQAGWDTVAFGSFTVLPKHDTEAMTLAVGQVLAERLGLELKQTPKTNRRTNSKTNATTKRSATS